MTTATDTTRAEQYTSALLALAAQLAPSEGFTTAGVVLARTKGGRLRVGFGDGWYSWFRGDTTDLLREHLIAALDWRQSGYHAGHIARELDTLIVNPYAYACSGVGRDAFRFVRDSRRKLNPIAADR